MNKNYEFFPNTNINIHNEDMDTMIIHGGTYNEINIANSNIKKLIIDGDIICPGFEVTPAISGSTVEEVVFSEKATIVPKLLFYNNDINNLNLGNIEVIGPYAFDVNTIKNIKWSNNLVIIHNNAFARANFKEKIKFPESLMFISQDAFYNAKIIDIELNSNLKGIGCDAFPDEILERDDVSECLNSSMPAIIKDKKIYKILDCSNEEINDYVEEIAPYAYSNSTVIAPYTTEFKNLKKIDIYAFAYSSNYKEIILPDEIKDIPKYSFYKSSVKKIKANNIEKINDFAFAYSHIKEINLNKIKTLGIQSFYFTKLEPFKIPGNIKTIPNSCFQYSKADSIEIEKGVERIEENAISLRGDINPINIELPNSIKESKLEKIDDLGFYGCNLNNINFENLSFLGIEAFQSANIKEIDIPGSVKVIPYGCFNGTTTNYIKLNEGTEKIETFAFKTRCNNNKINIKLPNSLKEIGRMSLVFYNTAKDSTLTLPASVERISKEFTAFEDFKELKLSIPQNILKLKKFNIPLTANVEIKELDLDDLILSGYSTSEINQIYKTIEER